jgi:protein-L-isoaspartate(D-aspartate) O-methyltransferase
MLLIMTLEDCRSFYAEEVQLAAGLEPGPLVEAFSRVPRENFVGPGPWFIGTADGNSGLARYIDTRDNDPRRIYHNVVISLDRSRDLTNGQPGSLARWIDALTLKPGARVFHLGAGVGYYTAILAEMVGPSGEIIASEVHPELAERARQNLSDRPNVKLHVADGATVDPGVCDAMLINAGVTHALPLWLDRLAPNGRLVLPLTVPMSTHLGKGAMVRITRLPAAYSAQIITFVAIYSCTSVRDPQLEQALGKSMGTGVLMKMKSVRRDQHDISESCAVHGDGFCISTLDIAEPTV